MQVNGPEGQKGARKKFLAVSKHIWLYTDVPQALKREQKREPSRTMFSLDGTLISAPAAPHCGSKARGRARQSRARAGQG